MVSEYLQSRHDACRELVDRLSARYEYVSVLGKHVTGKRVNVSTVNTSVSDTREGQCGFVVKVYDGTHYSEFSFSDITPEIIEAAVEAELKLKSRKGGTISPGTVNDAYHLISTVLQKYAHLSPGVDKVEEQDVPRVVLPPEQIYPAVKDGHGAACAAGNVARYECKRNTRSYEKPLYNQRQIVHDRNRRPDGER